MVSWHFRQTDLRGAFERLRSVQFDPIAPVGCNHDLVLQSRVPGYKIGDWQELAYAERFVYDGWDKQACLVPMEGWPLRRVFHDLHRPSFRRIFDDHASAVDAVLAELRDRGPLVPKEFEFQERRDDWTGSWFGPNLTKQALRALWHTGEVMTTQRRGGQHVYDLTERVLPPELHASPKISFEESVKGLVLERHRAVGLLRPTASYEVWSFNKVGHIKKAAYDDACAAGTLVPVDVEGTLFYATPAFLNGVGQEPPREVRFIAPLDQFMWDRKAISHLFGFEYIWEIYVPEPKRRWGYYVLPVLFGDSLVARVEFWCRNGMLEVRCWHWEAGVEPKEVVDGLTVAAERFFHFASVRDVTFARPVDPVVKGAFRAALKASKR